MTHVEKVFEAVTAYYSSNSPEQFLHATKDDLLKIEGVGQVRADLILAVREYCKNLYENALPKRYAIRCPEDAAKYMMDKMRFLTQEHFVCLFLNTKNEIIYEETIFIGSLNASVVHPREVFNRAVKLAAASIICLHNHPSGNPEQSREDVDVTKRLVEAGKIMGIDVLDHLIIGDKRFVSLKEKGFI